MTRRPYIDWLRGLAVLLMIEAHTTDAWTRLAVKRTHAFYVAGFFGGFAAPLFLWLAGLSMVLAGASLVARRQRRLDALDSLCRRGLEIFILAFLFRLQAFVLSPGGHPVTIFRVDILNVMGPAIVVAALIWFASSRPLLQALLFATVTISIAMVTPIVRTLSFVDRLPLWFQWYVRPFGEHTTFTMFPWAGFVFAGAACGTLLATVRTSVDERRLQAIFAITGASLLWFGWWASKQPSIYAQSSFWTSSPTWFAIRVGVIMTALAAVYCLAEVCRAVGVTAGWLERFGRNSLFVYWIHVELVYGYASWFWRGRLPLWGTALAFGVFVSLMYQAILTRDRAIAAWRARPHRRTAPQTATV